MFGVEKFCDRNLALQLFHVLMEQDVLLMLPVPRVFLKPENFQYCLQLKPQCTFRFTQINYEYS